MSTPDRQMPVSIEEEMKRSYMDYAMSVIIGRALPDIRDGLKPVHRRVLYSMHEQKNVWNQPYRKSARIVGDVIGKYHPHGDVAVYDTLVRMAQDFSLRYLLVDGQGNFGSMDGDPPAAMRYTEIRLERLAHELLEDIDKETVDFMPNYDETTTEPVVLPTRVPNLLVNGATGIAVGMSTNIPPHNLREIIDAAVAVISNPDVSIEELLEIVKGPDFPTGAFIHGMAGIRQAYRTGRGLIRVRARTRVEKLKGERENIIVSEIPFMQNKARIIEKIADLVKTKRIEGIGDVRDESDRDGVRVVIELKRGENATVILNQLFKNTPLQSTFGIIFLAIKDQRPRILNLKELLEGFIDHRRDVVTRRSRYELRKAEERAHILEGYQKALDHIDEVIAMIRAAASPQEAKEALVARLNFTEIQAQAILDLRLQRLTGLEREKIRAELVETLKTMAYLREILGNDRLLMQLIMDEMNAIREKYGDDRRTEIVPVEEEIGLEDVITEEEMVVTCSHTGYIKRSALSQYRAQRRGGKGRIGMRTKEEDFVEHVFIASTHSYILIFTTLGRVHWLKVHVIPEVGTLGKGKAIVNLLSLRDGETVATLLPVKDFNVGRYVVLGTRKGIVKKTELLAFSSPRAGGIIGIAIDEDDTLLKAAISNGSQDIFLGTRRGMAIRFSEDDIRGTGRSSRGVIGVRLMPGDEVIGMEVVETTGAILSVTEKGYGKRTTVNEYRRQTRGGKGLINVKTTERNGTVVGLLYVGEDDEIMLITQNGMIIRLTVSHIRRIGRSTQGVRLIQLEAEDRLVGVAKLAEKEDEEPGEGEVPPEVGEGAILDQYENVAEQGADEDELPPGDADGDLPGDTEPAGNGEGEEGEE